MKLAANIVANYVGQGWSAAMSLAFVPVYVKLLGIESYALIGIYAALQAWLALLDLGLSPTLQREMARFSAGTLTPVAIRDLLRSVELICAAIGIAVAALMAGGAHFVATGWFTTDLPASIVELALTVMGSVVALRFVESVYRSALFGLERQVWYNGVNVMLTTARSAGAALVIWLVQPSIAAFFWWQLIVSVVAVAVLRVKLGALLPRGARKARFSVPALREIRHFAAGMIGINLTALVLTQADKVILSRLLPLAAFGHYTLAFTMCSIVVALTGPIVQAVYPGLARLHAIGDGPAFMAAYHRGAQMLAVAAVSVAGVLALFAPEVIWTWTGDPRLVASVGPLLSLFAAGTLFNALMQMPYFGLLAVGETRFPMRANLVAAAGLILALIVLVPRYGAVAGCAVWLALNLAYVCIGLPVLHRHHLRGALSPWLRTDTGPALISGLAVCGLLRTVTWSLDMSRGAWLIGLAVVGMATLLATLLATPALRGLLVEVVRSARARPRYVSPLEGP